MPADSVCIVRYDYHPGDSRIENQAQALLDAGWAVDILCMHRAGDPITDTANGIRIFRLPAFARMRGNVLMYFVEYFTFGIMALFVLSALHLWRRYRLVQVCNLPDFLVFTALIPKLTGAKILFDFRECMPEMYAAKFERPMTSRLVRFMASLEQSCVRFSDLAVTCTEQMRQATISRGTPPEKIFVMLNSVDPKKFHDVDLPDPNEAVGETFTILTHGSIIPRYGHETLIRAMQRVKAEAPEARLLVLGQGQQRGEMEALSLELHLDDVVSFLGFVSYPELMQHLRNVHVGAVTMVRNPETDLIHTIKMQEYMILGIPIVISRTSAVEAYFDESCVQFFQAENPDELAAALLQLRNDPALRHEQAKRAYQQCGAYDASGQKQIFANKVSTLINRATHGQKVDDKSRQTVEP